MKRRKFFSMLTKISISAVAFFEGLIHLGSLSPRVLYEPDKRFKTLSPDQFPEGVSFLAEQKVFVVKDRNKVKAISAVCTHLGCIVKKADHLAPRKLKSGGKTVSERWEYRCNCHGSKFHADGFNYTGPAPSPLPHFQVEISPDDGSLLVNKGVEVGEDEFLELKEVLS
ncbi:MAG: ubiquinol-cytochrome c reductase iron-sulfur subunit [bacterium]|nr:ubiquinol-cytochrome c reductase iron-sulfur subunit [bacterium]